MTSPKCLALRKAGLGIRSEPPPAPTGEFRENTGSYWRSITEGGRPPRHRHLQWIGAGFTWTRGHHRDHGCQWRADRPRIPNIEGAAGLHLSSLAAAEICHLARTYDISLECDSDFRRGNHPRPL